jgi:hypothetical protein
MGKKDFVVDHITMLLPLVGRLVDMDDPEGKRITARIIGVNDDGVHLREVPQGTKE